ncbi:MAG: mercuric transporter MerT family protein [Ghiorsea sp.]|nr:mercuric transporter MerT family protein [Ghiorsea sp.]
MNKLVILNQKVSLFGAIIAGMLASACCIGPFVLVILGMGSVSALMIFEPFRPLFMVITFGLLVWTGWLYWQSRKTCIIQGCPPPKPLWLWIMGFIAMALLFFPYLLPFLLQLGR